MYWERMSREERKGLVLGENEQGREERACIGRE